MSQDLSLKQTNLLPFVKRQPNMMEFIFHIFEMRGTDLFRSIDELINISKESNIRAEIYHLKQAGKSNWYKLDGVIKKIESARSNGISITADMYNYIAGATGLDASMPPWVQEGGRF